MVTGAGIGQGIYLRTDDLIKNANEAERTGQDMISNWEGNHGRRFANF